jgi:hypothetical protein
MRFACELRPGIGRWVGMQRAARTHTAALAAGILSQKHCGEPDAGPFCIAAPVGTGKLANVLSMILILGYGGYRSVIAIETSGGGDDRQWLTFWFITVGVSFVERAFTRVLLSKFPVYYEMKLIVLIWLLFFDGANRCYRKIRRYLSKLSPVFALIMDRNSHVGAQNQLDIMMDIGGKLIIDQLAIFEKKVQEDPSKRSSIVSMGRTSSVFSGEKGKSVLERKIESLMLQQWEYDYTATESSNNGTTANAIDATEKLFYLSRWMLSAEGLQEMENQNVPSDVVAMLLERAAALISFQPRYLHIHLVGTKPGIGKLPVMDRNGQADCYVKFHTKVIMEISDRTEVPSGSQSLGEEVRSKIVYKSREPMWNENLEIEVKGGIIDLDGNYRNNTTRNTVLHVEAWDADVGAWGVGYEAFQVMYYAIICSLLVLHIMGKLDASESPYVQTPLILGCGVFIVLGYALCYLKAKVWRSDDEFIGSCDVPLDILLDQREHSLLLRLQNPSNRKTSHGTSEGFGILRVKLSMSE